MELGPTSYVILGLLGLGPHSGYDIKQLADMYSFLFAQLGMTAKK